MFTIGTSSLHRAALGEIKNNLGRHNSVSTDVPSKEFKEPLKPSLNKRWIGYFDLEL